MTDPVYLLFHRPEGPDTPSPKPGDPNESEQYLDLSNPHILRMALFSIEIARSGAVQEPCVLDDIYFSALLHDVGKTMLREEVLNKPAPLTPEERAHVETHAALGGEMVGQIPGWERVSRSVRAHHEWWDGSGYPDRLQGETIPLPARIVAVADVFDALTTRRPYREPLPVRAAIRHIRNGSGTHFDPEVVEAFLKIPDVEWEHFRRQAELLASDGLIQIHSWYFQLDENARRSEL
ncbi:MAG: HD domain-containing protein [Armatimonadetes bacterium]|nr:HD domain-containing protein [Armatimonadota bacterium]